MLFNSDQENDSNINTAETSYTQKDVDNIVSKVKSKYEEKYISKAEYNSVVRELSKLRAETNFISNGGNKDYFEDFYKLEADNLAKMSNEDLDNYYSQVKETKSWAFENNSKDPVVSQPNTKDVVDELLGAGPDDLVPGTIYKIWK